MERDRRWLLQRIGVLSSLPLLGGSLAHAAETCMRTARQTRGPFYPVSQKPDSDADLTTIPGKAEKASGQVAVVTGRVRDLDCRPLGGAKVEIWQACASGRYDHPRDRNPAPLDPHFQYWGEIVTAEDGSFSFRTIKPGAYPFQPGWDRPPHIHFQVKAEGYSTLVTQMYFEGEELNDKDRILGALAPDQRRFVIVPFVRGSADEITGRFEIVLGPASAGGTTPRLE